METEKILNHTKIKKYKNLIFSNSISNPKIFEGNILKMMSKLLFEKNKRMPQKPIPILQLEKDDFIKKSNSSLRLSRFGHSTVYIEIEGYKILTDPVFSHRASPVQFAGPSRFHPTPVIIENLPKIDAVIISHNHYDHLDAISIKKLKNKAKKFFVPLGIGSILQSWGIPSSNIVQLNWWESQHIGNNLSIVSTPSQHFSGRKIIDNNKTLWSSWSIIGNSHKVYFSGDTGFFSGFSEIGKKYGPFDITLLECGAYNTAWNDIHMFPEETLKAHHLLRGNILFPIHWGTFDLSLHNWIEPIERLIKVAEKSSTKLAIPKIGEFIDYESLKPIKNWWDLSS